MRGDNEWGRLHPEEAQRIFLLSERTLATGDTVDIEIMQYFLKDEFDPDTSYLDRWEVYDRTEGVLVNDWTYDEKTGIVTVKNTKKFHEYTVSFLARITWHPVQIYNYLTNEWTCEKQLTYDPAFPNTREYIKRHMEEWCLVI